MDDGAPTSAAAGGGDAAVTAAKDDAGASALAEDAGAVSAAEDDDAPGSVPPDEVSEAVSAFWAASDAVDRSSATVLGESDDDAPADTWFDPSIGDSLDDLVEADDLEEPGEVRRSNAGPRAAE